ncbi:MAG: hypothetical protein HY051_00700 [Candidatus Aenigmarchaeota archaeon]|nr:hypothetical protein [Candidatus Aenigmarchaeota archaeon]
MTDVEIKLPKILEKNKSEVEKRIGELVSFEAKRRSLLEFIDETMKGAAQLDDEELVRFGKKIKKGRFDNLKKQRLL